MSQITCQSHHYYLVYACLSQVHKVHSAICAMSNFVEQRSAKKFCLRNDISAAETYQMLQKAFGDETMSQNAEISSKKRRVQACKAMLSDY